MFHESDPATIDRLKTFPTLPEIKLPGEVFAHKELQEVVAAWRRYERKRIEYQEVADKIEGDCDEYIRSAGAHDYNRTGYQLLRTERGPKLMSAAILEFTNLVITQVHNQYPADHRN